MINKRPLGTVHFAIYTRTERTTVEALENKDFEKKEDLEESDTKESATPLQGATDWVDFSPVDATPPSVRWQRKRLNRRVVLTATSVQPVLEACASGLGRCVLPTFIGDSEPRLSRIGKPIAELSHRQWLVLHDDDRHHPPIRAVADLLTQLLSTDV